MGERASWSVITTLEPCGKPEGEQVILHSTR